MYVKALIESKLRTTGGNEIEKHVFKFVMFYQQIITIYVSDTELKLKT